MARKPRAESVPMREGAWQQRRLLEPGSPRHRSASVPTQPGCCCPEGTLPAPEVRLGPTPRPRWQPSLPFQDPGAGATNLLCATSPMRHSQPILLERPAASASRSGWSSAAKTFQRGETEAAPPRVGVEGWSRPGHAHSVAAPGRPELPAGLGGRRNLAQGLGSRPLPASFPLLKFGFRLSRKAPVAWTKPVGFTAQS